MPYFYFFFLFLSFTGRLAPAATSKRVEERNLFLREI
jgi:hypothetical protein